MSRALDLARLAVVGVCLVVLCACYGVEVIDP